MDLIHQKDTTGKSQTQERISVAIIDLLNINLYIQFNNSYSLLFSAILYAVLWPYCFVIIVIFL